MSHEGQKKHLTSLSACFLMVLVAAGILCSRAEKGQAISTLEVANGVRVVEKSMALNSLTIAEGVSMAAPEGKSLTMLVNGKKTKIEAGKYAGKIQMVVS